MPPAKPGSKTGNRKGKSRGFPDNDNLLCVYCHHIDSILPLICRYIMVNSLSAYGQKNEHYAIFFIDSILSFC